MRSEAAHPVPVQAKFGNDFVTLLVMLMSTDTVDQAAEKVAYHVVGRRVARRDAPLGVHYEGHLLAPGLSVEQAGIRPLQYIFVDYL